MGRVPAAGLVERLMQRTLEKAQGLRCSDWEAYPLSAQQRKYAAADVFASLRVFEVRSLGGWGRYAFVLFWGRYYNTLQTFNVHGANRTHGTRISLLE